MKKPANIWLVITISGVLSAAVLAAPPIETDNPGEAIKRVLNQHDVAMNKQDIKALMALYVDDPGIVLMGTGAGEVWKGKAAITEIYQQLFKDFKPGSLKHQCPEFSSGQEGDVAWLTASCTMQDAMTDGQRRDYVLNVSGVLKKEKMGWKFQIRHFSDLTSGNPPSSEIAPSPEDAPP